MELLWNFLFLRHKVKTKIQYILLWQKWLWIVDILKLRKSFTDEKKQEDISEERNCKNT